MKGKDIKLDQINNTWREVITLFTTTYSEITSVFVKILKLFDVWIVSRVRKLEGGGILTSDLLVFEENLSVRVFWELKSHCCVCVCVCFVEA